MLPAPRFLRATLPLLAIAGLAACGETLASRVTRAVTGCIDFRNPAFTSGQGTTSLATPLPDSLSALSTRIAYARGLSALEAISEQAPDQVTLVCALEVASYYKSIDVGRLLFQYTAHPDEAVAASAERLLETQDPLPDRITNARR